MSRFTIPSAGGVLADSEPSAPVLALTPPTAPKQVGLFGQPVHTSVHTYETSLRPAIVAPRRILPARLGCDLSIPDDVLSYADAGWRLREHQQRQRDGIQDGSPWGVTLATSGEIARRHSWWQARRLRVRAALKRAGFPASRLERFDNCGAATFVLVQKVAPYRHRRASNKCRDRHCEPCQIERANKYAANLKKHLSQYKGRADRRFRFVTLTLRSKPAPDPEQEGAFIASEMRRLIKCIGKLRRIRLCFLKPRKLLCWWNRYVLGGAYFLEATLNDKPESPDFGLWHIHAHLIVEGSYLPQDELASLWKTATGDSEIVDVRALSGVDEAAAELSKYASKGADAKLSCDGDKLLHWMLGTKSLRLCSTFGTWRGVRLAAALDEFKPGEWVNLGREDDIRTRAALGDAWARAIITALERDTEANKKRRPPPKFDKRSLTDGKYTPRHGS